MAQDNRLNKKDSSIFSKPMGIGGSAGAKRKLKAIAGAQGTGQKELTSGLPAGTELAITDFLENQTGLTGQKPSPHDFIKLVQNDPEF
jgi:hypothetical protein